MQAAYINWARELASQFLASFLQHNKLYYFEFKMDAEQVD